MWFWDPYGGNDNWDGKAADRAFKTFAKAHGSAKNFNHDTIMIVPGDPSGTTVITEAITITKSYLFIRGPGRDVLFKHTSEDVSIRVEGNGIELSGFRIENSTEDGVAVHSTGAFTLIENVWLEACDSGMLFEDHHPIITNVKIHKPKHYGIRMVGDISHGEITNVTCGSSANNILEIDTTAESGGIKMRDSVLTLAQGTAVWLGEDTQKFMAFNSNIITGNEIDWDDTSTNQDNVNYAQGSDAEAQKVWEYEPRTVTTVTESSGLTQEEHDQLMATATVVDTVVASQL